MHLSLLSDGFLSDSLRDHGPFSSLDATDAGRLHRDGVLRGLVFVLALTTPFLLVLGLSMARDTLDGISVPSALAPAGVRTASIHLSR